MIYRLLKQSKTRLKTLNLYQIFEKFGSRNLDVTLKRGFRLRQNTCKKAKCFVPYRRPHNLVVSLINSEKSLCPINTLYFRKSYLLGVTHEVTNLDPYMGPQ